jgi:pimeloyl-ACP methyl ester carboxylesterase
MPKATIRGAQIAYDIVGSSGPWCVLTTAGRYDLDHDRALAEKIAAGGYRVVLHDRRNIGASDVGIGPEATEDMIFADDVHELLGMLGAAPAIVIGVMAGNRTSFNLVRRHPESVRALLVLFPSGGKAPADILAESYYGQYARIAETGGMQAVCKTPYYRERIEQNPRNRDLLLAMDRDEFIAAMKRWDAAMLASADLPTIGFTEQMLREIAVPTLAFPGLIDDHIHGHRPGAEVGRLVPGARIVQLSEIRKPENPHPRWLFDLVAQRMADPDLAPAMLQFMDEFSGQVAA